MTAIHQATCISILPCPLQHAFCSYLVLTQHFLSSTNVLKLMLWYLGTGKVSIGKINTPIWFPCMKKRKNLMGDKKNEARGPLTRWNLKRHILLVLCHNIVAVRCFVGCLGLRGWSGSETKFQVLTIFLKINNQPSEDAVLF